MLRVEQADTETQSNGAKYGLQGRARRGILFPFPLLSSEECSDCQHAVTRCGWSDTEGGWRYDDKNEEINKICQNFIKPEDRL